MVKVEKNTAGKMEEWKSDSGIEKKMKLAGNCHLMTTNLSNIEFTPEIILR